MLRFMRLRRGWFFPLIKSLAIIALLLVAACAARAGSIFDDDWVPPPQHKTQTILPRLKLPPTTLPADSTPTATSPPTPTQAQSPGQAQATSPTPSDSGSKPRITARAAPAATAPARRPVPDKVAQAKSRRLFKDIFAKELADRSVT